MTATFITGGFGHLGRHIVKAVSGLNPDGGIRLLVRTPRRPPSELEDLPGVRMIRGDLTRPETYAAGLEGASSVIHAAALVSFKPSDAPDLYRSNVLGTRRLLEAAAAAGCRNFIYVSSIAAVGRPEPPDPADESLMPDLEEKRRIDPYGYSKRLGELEIERAGGRIRRIILNPSVFIGPGSRRLDALLRVLKHLPAVPMIPARNSFVDVRDVARAAVAALSAGRDGERYIVNGCDVDMPEFTRVLLKAMGLRRPVKVVPGSVLRAADGLIRLLTAFNLNPGLRPLGTVNVDRAYATGKIRGEMGWAPAYSLEQSLRDTAGRGPSLPPGSDGLQAL